MLKWIVGFVLVLTAAAATGGWCWLRASRARVEGEVKLPGLAATVTVVRDRRGVPSITADSEPDAFFALGYAHAQDRFFQMDLARRVTQGRVSELVGEKAIDLDQRMRRFGLHRAAQRSIAALLPQTQAVLTAYAAGINAWLGDGGQRLPPELDLLSLRGAPHRPEPWAPADSVAILKFLSLLLDGDFAEEMAHAPLVDKIGPERAEALEHPARPWGEGTEILPAVAAPPAPPPAAPSVPSHGQRSGPAPDRAWADIRALRELLGGGAEIGSNSWVISGKRTQSGYPLLSNDPHLAVQSPSQWYATRIIAPGLRVAGVTIPGIPAVILGRNARIAWGITAMHGDVQDLFIEHVDPANPAAYLVGKRSEPFGVREEKIQVAGGATITMQVRTTRHGPIIVDNWRGQGPLALSWIACAEDDTSLDSLLGTDRAGSWSEFLAAASRAVAPVVNFTYADVDGHIGYLAPGRVPIRTVGDGSQPTDGAAPDAIWSRFIPFDELPHVLDPPEGFIVSANQRVEGPAYHNRLGNRWAAPFRAKRIRELLTAQDKLGAGDLPRLHADVISVSARQLLPQLTALTSTDAKEAAALELLRHWDGAFAADSAAALLFSTWVTTLKDLVFSDDLGEELAASTVRAEHLLLALTESDGHWCDDQRTPAKESCRDQLAPSLKQAIQWISARQGDDPARWRLDKAIHLRFTSRVMAAIPILGRLYTRDVRDWGDSSTVHVAGYDDGFNVYGISTFFGDYDLRPDGGAKLGIALGQSAHPLSPHFDDMLDAWSRSDAPPLDPPEPGGEARLRLLPR